MTTLDYLHQVVVPASSQLLPPAMHSPQATAMLLAIALQESAAAHRKQVKGPARGWWQFESNGVAGVLEHVASRIPMQHVCATLRYVTRAKTCHVAIEHNDILAGCFARCLLWTLPDPLPEQTRPDVGWKQYLKAWRPGKPHPDQWLGNFEQAWALVAPRREDEAMLSNYQHDIAALAQQHPEAWRNAHTGNVQTEDFIRLAAAALHAKDPNVGLNGKRGNPSDISDDALAVFAEDGDVTDRTGRKMFIIDCIAGAGGSNPQPAWASVGGPSPGAWVKPEAVTPGKPPQPPAPPPPPPVVLPDRSEMMQEGQFLHAYYVSPWGLQRPQGLWIVGPDGIGHPDWEGIGAWLLDVYLKARVAGKSRAEARADYVKQIRESSEWRTKHPGETP